MRRMKRIERVHESGALQVLVNRLEDLTVAERAEVPADTLDLFTTWEDRISELPRELAWARGALRSRRWPVLERCDNDGRVYWSVRMPLHLREDMLAGPCVGSDGRRRTPGPDAPELLRWLAGIGRMDLVSEQSGSAPWGQPLSEFSRDSLGYWFSSDGDPATAELPDGSEHWVCLYEVDGDAVFADLATGVAWWVGTEWTGKGQLAVSTNWRAVAIYVFWALLEGRWVRPRDLAMLESTRTLPSD